MLINGLNKFRWSAIATHLPGRTDNEIKNFWNTHLKKKLIQMGFDPMTHQPRTDIFSSLPHLIALANLKDLIDNPTWEDQAMRLQTEVLQMSRLNHYLHYILQPSLPPPSLQNAAALPELTLFNSLKDTTSVLTHLETPPVNYLHDSVPFSHLPDLQAPAAAVGNCLSKTAMARGSDQYGAVLSQGDNSPDGSSSPWVAAPPPLTTETSITNTGDACSTSSYGGAQMWSELLDDPFFHEMA